MWNGESSFKTVRDGFTKKVMSEQKLKGNERVSPEGIRGKNVPNRGNSSCKGPEVKVSLVCWKNMEEASVTEVE